MSKVQTTDFSTEGFFSDVPNETLFEIFRRLPKGKLMELSKLCLRFRYVVEDTRFWKDMYTKTRSIHTKWFPTIAFEELYSGPWPVEVIDLSGTKINPPVSFQTDHVVKVTRLDMSGIEANEVTVETIFDRYQCTELNLDREFERIPPEAFSKLTALEVLSLRHIEHSSFDETALVPGFYKWLSQALDHCKNLKSLDLEYTSWTDLEMLDLVKHLPISLEKLSIVDFRPRFFLTSPDKDYVFEMLAKYAPNLKDLALCASKIQCPSLLKFQFLEILRFVPWGSISSLCKNLIQFPALKTVYAGGWELPRELHIRIEDNFRIIRTALEPHGIIVEKSFRLRCYPEDENNL